MVSSDTRGDEKLITYVKKDLLTAKEPFIAHGCNAKGVMGSGVARLIREKWPKAYERYREEFEACKAMGVELPLGSVIGVPYPDVTILNMITQPTYGRDTLRHVSYDAVDACFKSLRYGPVLGKTLAIPKIGAGLGGGSWPIIEAIIHNASALHYSVVVYEGVQVLGNGVQAPT